MVRTDTIILLGLAITLVLYVLVGGAVFYAIENPIEKENMQVARSTMKNFIVDFSCVNQSQFFAFLDTAKRLWRNGIRLQNKNIEPTLWTYSSSVNFASTVVTTIGYGNPTPVTSVSKIFCCIYAIFGIPLCLATLSRIGELFAKFNDGMVSRLVKWPKTEPRYAILRLTLLFINGGTLFVFIPSISFSYSEGWPYLTSLYFSIITISTVGFGDYMLINRAIERNLFFEVANTVWIFFGLAWFASIMSTMQRGMTERVNSVANSKDEVKVAELTENPSSDDRKSDLTRHN